MIDTHAALRQYLINDDTLAGLVGSAIYWPRLPLNWELGPAILFNAAGGNSDPDKLDVTLLFEFRCFGSDSIEAGDIYRALWDALHGTANVFVAETEIISAFESDGRQDFIDPDNNWPFVYSTFLVKFKP